MLNSLKSRLFQYRNERFWRCQFKSLNQGAVESLCEFAKRIRNVAASAYPEVFREQFSQVIYNQEMQVQLRELEQDFLETTRAQQLESIKKTTRNR